MRVSRIWRSRGGFVCGDKAVCGSVFSGKWDAGDILSRVFPRTIRTLFRRRDGADADMTAQPEQMEQEIDEAGQRGAFQLSVFRRQFQFDASVLRGIGEQGDKSIVTVSSGKQDTDIFGNPVENTGDYAGAVIAESDGEFLILLTPMRCGRQIRSM